MESGNLGYMEEDRCGRKGFLVEYRKERRSMQHQGEGNSVGENSRLSGSNRFCRRREEED